MPSDKTIGGGDDAFNTFFSETGESPYRSQEERIVVERTFDQEGLETVFFLPRILLLAVTNPQLSMSFRFSGQSPHNPHPSYDIFGSVIRGQLNRDATVPQTLVVQM